uniref:Uncharacterized protein n=1 Tax=Trichogramma kaykai TaxID=54128 RepID=A0ABD2WBC3_9HYME
MVYLFDMAPFLNSCIEDLRLYCNSSARRPARMACPTWRSSSLLPRVPTSSCESTRRAWRPASSRLAGSARDSSCSQSQASLPTSHILPFDKKRYHFEAPTTISERKMEISIDKLIFCYVMVYMCMLTKIKSNVHFHMINFFILAENNCTSEQFVCHEVINQCVPLNWICDGNADCFDGSDEIECSKKNVYSISYLYHS